jgi:ureidoglycolate dehydrogenase (NAD+)
VTDTDQTARGVRIADLRACLAAGLERVGVPPGDAGLIADVLVDAELRGHDDHGAAFLGLLVGWYRAGALNPRPQIRVVQETPSALLLDGDRGCGVLPALRAMRWCVGRARAQRGIASAGVRNAGHCVASAPYVALAAEAGVLGFACANTAPSMAPPGGRTATLSTNPLAYGVPAGRHPPVVFDMATSTVAAVKVLQAATAGRPVPEGWVTDAQGRPTTDPTAFWRLGDGPPARVGLMLPLGAPAAAHKGFGLAMLVDVLAGVLTGAGSAQEVALAAGNLGQFFWALDPAVFGPREAFLARVDALLDQVKASERLEGVDEIVLPGERGHRRRAAAVARGTVALTDATWGSLTRTCAALGVAVPPVLPAPGP